jgi:hypothetical protein
MLLQLSLGDSLSSDAALNKPPRTWSFSMPSGISAPLHRRTSSYAVRWKGTRPASSGMSRSNTKRSTSVLLAPAPRPSGGDSLHASEQVCRQACSMMN